MADDCNDPVTGEQDVAVRAQMMALLATARQQRETRLFQMILSIPRPVWVLLIVSSVVLIGFVVSCGIEYLSSHAAVAALFGGTLALFPVVVFARLFV